MTERETYFKRSTEDFLKVSTDDNSDLNVHAELLTPCDKDDENRVFVSTTHHEDIITSFSICKCEEQAEKANKAYLKPNSGIDGWSLVAKHLKPVPPPNSRQKSAN
ncbi:hypothetical protein [Pseudoalteromonas marina]|uniref:Uncharacterized protein n=1 Tax=Pseudoalteromonas marina TaxID=267375 RepID=A0ABT9FCE5_9GAMM|nr:hypothetical protein [Pseudoalteromonas marina]MDP2564466.1 hypothetical protein [Pseudoalteromonas marina]